MITSAAVLRELAAAMAADADVLRHRAPPAAGRLVAELIARGSAMFTTPASARCARDEMPLYAPQLEPGASRAPPASTPG